MNGILYHFYKTRLKVNCKSLELLEELCNDVRRSHHDSTAHFGQSKDIC